MALRKLKRVEMSKTDTEPVLQLLYVEDDDTNWEVTEKALRANAKVMRAHDAREAFALLNQHRFDMVLMDIELPGSDLSGIEITQILKGGFASTPPAYAHLEEPREIPVVFVTAYQARYSPGELMRVGGDATVTKPVDFPRLNLVLARLMARSACG